MPPASKAAAGKKALPAKAGVQGTITLRHLAAELADSYELPKKQAEAMLGDVVTLEHTTSEEGRQKSA